MKGDSLSDEFPPKPQEPSASDCCGTGCVPCVYDIYKQDLKLWKRECGCIKQRLSSSSNLNKVLASCKFEWVGEWIGEWSVKRANEWMNGWMNSEDLNLIMNGSLILWFIILGKLHKNVGDTRGI